MINIKRGYVKRLHDILSLFVDVYNLIFLHLLYHKRLLTICSFSDSILLVRKQDCGSC